MGTELLGSTEIQNVIPHRQPYLLTDSVSLEFDGRSELVSATGEWQSYLAEAAPGTFWSDVYPLDGPYERDNESGLYIARSEWAGFPGHFNIVPGVESIKKASEVVTNNDRTQIAGFDEATFPGMVPVGSRATFVSDAGSSPGETRVVVEGQEKDGLVLVGLKTQELEGRNPLSAAHIIESALQSAAVAALSTPGLKGKSRVPVITTLAGVEFSGGAEIGDKLIAHTKLTEVYRSTGTASIELVRERRGSKTDIGHVASAGFFALPPKMLGLGG